jgi:uncharacterized phage protein (TIGR01671 family)
MREILFRGKRVDNGEWVEGRLLANDVIVPSGQVFGVEGGKIFGCDLEAFVVLPESVSEFSGLYDKNGKKIFEGDIVRATTRDERITTITKIGIGLCEETESDVVCMGVYCTLNDEPYVLPCNDIFHNLIEIIGNIYDNPELLKESESK